ncbi:DJ-1/PfpI family protein, partial [Eggerthella sinensis]|uniref:DJ-1/PfpI family protein n=1 Tax=Eggerthella sinensis TaxID=242230 RepID=UPI0022E354F7
MQEKKTVLAFVFDGFADWEGAYVCAELNRELNGEPSPYTVKTVALDGAPKRSMGGFNVLPDYAVGEAPADACALLLLGGDAWLDGSNDTVLPLVERVQAAGALVGGICNAATFLAEHGFLDERAHTGNTLEFVQQGARSWPSTASWTNAPTRATRSSSCSRARRTTGRCALRGSAGRRRSGVITANGSAALEFA